MTHTATPITKPFGNAAEQSLFRRHRNLFTALLLVVAAWLIYLPSTQYRFVYYDDVRILLDHPELYGQPHLSGDLKAIFVTGFPREEPLLLRDVTWAIDSRIFGFGNAFGYHLGNVILHGFVVAMLFAFLLATTRRYGFSLAVTIAWLALAVHTEPLAWIMGRKDILSTFFMLASLWAQTRRLDSKNLPAQCGWYAATLALFFAGLMSKINVLAFPLVLLLHAIFLPYLRNERPPDSPLLLKLAQLCEILLFIPSIVISVLVYVWYHRILAQMGVFNRGYTAHGLGHLWNLLMVDPLALWLYLRQIFFPYHLTVLYTWPTLQVAYPLWQMVVSITSVIAACIVGLWLFCRRKDLFFYYAAFFVAMVPYLNLQFMAIWVAERYVYFSSIFVLAITVSLLGTLLQGPRPALRICVLALAAVCILVNLAQKFSYQPEWRNGETLWQYDITLPHPSPTAYGNLAAYYYADAVAHQNMPQMAVPMSKMEVVVEAGLKEFWPDRQQPPPTSTYYLFFLQSIIQEVKGDREGALESLLTADRLHPEFDAINLNLAQLYRKLAETSRDPHQQETYARAAQSRYDEYIKLDFQGRPASPEITQQLTELESEFPVLSHPINNGK